MQAGLTVICAAVAGQADQAVPNPAPQALSRPPTDLAAPAPQRLLTLATNAADRVVALLTLDADTGTDAHPAPAETGQAGAPVGGPPAACLALQAEGCGGAGLAGRDTAAGQAAASLVEVCRRAARASRWPVHAGLAGLLAGLARQDVGVQVPADLAGHAGRRILPAVRAATGTRPAHSRDRPLPILAQQAEIRGTADPAGRLAPHAFITGPEVEQVAEQAGRGTAVLAELGAGLAEVGGGL